MTEVPESRAEATAVTEQPRHVRYDRPNRLSQALAWVGIIAGVLFVVALIFFSGVFFGSSSGGHHGWHRGYDGDRSGCYSGQMGPGQMGPGGMMGPGATMGPSPMPTTTAPTPPRQ